MLVRCYEGLVAELLLEVHAQSLDTVTHAITRLDAGQILQKFWRHAHLLRLHTQRILIRHVVVATTGLGALCLRSRSHATTHHSVLLATARLHYTLVIHLGTSKTTAEASTGRLLWLSESLYLSIDKPIVVTLHLLLRGFSFSRGLSCAETSRLSVL